MAKHPPEPLHPQAPELQGEQLSGTVERITYHNKENGFSVLKIRTKGNREPVSVVGTTPLLSPGELVHCTGNWQNSRVHGLQFKAASITVVPPDTAEGIEKYLASGMVKGIGTFYSKKLIKKFGTDVLDILDNNPEKLLEVPGIGQKRLDIITKSWEEQKAIREIMVFLQANGVGIARAFRI